MNTDQTPRSTEEVKVIKTEVETKKKGETFFLVVAVICGLVGIIGGLGLMYATNLEHDTKKMTHEREMKFLHLAELGISVPVIPEPVVAVRNDTSSASSEPVFHRASLASLITGSKEESQVREVKRVKKPDAKSCVIKERRVVLLANESCDLPGRQPSDGVRTTVMSRDVVFDLSRCDSQEKKEYTAAERSAAHHFLNEASCTRIEVKKGRYKVFFNPKS